MADQQHLQWLSEGAPSWNERRRHEDFKPDLSGADLSKFIGYGLDLSIADLHRADLTGVQLLEADLSQASLNEAILKNAHFTHANFTDSWFISANLTEADLSNAILRGAQFQLANLTDANLTSADLADANFSMANLTRTCLAYAQLWQASLFGAFMFYPGESNKTVEQHSFDSIDINTTDDLLKFMRSMKQIYAGHDEEVIFYFRGEPRNDWELSPSIMREEMRGIAPRENEMLRNLISRRPSEFIGQQSAMAHWTLAQHHELKTRFLDITKNPLAGLFFACESNNNCAGRFHIFAVPRSLVKSYDSDAIRIVANFARMTHYDRLGLSGKLPRIPDTGTFSHYDFTIDAPVAPSQYRTAFQRLYYLIREEKPHFEERIDIRDFYRVFVVEPQQSSERIRAQAGAFLVSAFHERFERDEILAKTKDLPIYAHYTLGVPSESKASLLDELASLSITREALFPGLDESAQAVIDEAQRRSR